MSQGFATVGNIELIMIEIVPYFMTLIFTIYAGIKIYIEIKRQYKEITTQHIKLYFVLFSFPLIFFVCYFSIILKRLVMVCTNDSNTL